MSVGEVFGAGIKKIKNFYRKRHTIVTANITLSSPFEALKGRNIVVTGGSRGLGYYIAKKCIDEGANVLITGRNVDSLKESALILGNQCNYMQLDMSDTEHFDGFFEKAEKLMKCDKIDSVVGNAGITILENSFLNVTENSWNKQMGINLKGNYFFVQEFAKYLNQKPDANGNIVIVASERGLRSPDIPYDISKKALISFIQGVAPSLFEKNIRINAVAPGACATDVDKCDEGANLFCHYQISQRLYKPEEVAEVINFLLSDFSSCISGEVIACDNGNYIAKW